MARTRLILILGLLSGAPVFTAQAAASNAISLLNGVAVVPAGSYVAWRVPADENPAQSGVVVGELRSQDGTKSPFAVAVMTESDFTSWKKGYRAYPLYVARQVSRVALRTRLPRADVYYVVVSNPLRPPHPSTIRGRLQLVWAPPTNAMVSATQGTHEGVRRDLLSFGVVLLLAGALALWSILEGRREEEAATVSVAEKRAA